MDENKAIVVGASSGIGMEVARQLVAAGWTLGVAARREDRLRALQQECGTGVAAVQTIDVTTAEAGADLRRLIDALGGMALFVYAAGIGRQNPELEEGIELATVETNGVGFTRMIGEAYRYFAAHGGLGHIVAITSIAGTKGLGPAPAYSATKALQATYLQALEQQIVKRGLHVAVTDIRPGFVDTDLLSGNHHYPMLMRPERVAARIVRAISRREHVVVTDWRYRLLTALWRRVPRWLWRRLKL